MCYKLGVELAYLVTFENQAVTKSKGIDKAHLLQLVYMRDYEVLKAGKRSEQMFQTVVYLKRGEIWGGKVKREEAEPHEYPRFCIEFQSLLTNKRNSLGYSAEEKSKVSQIL